ncbi:MAG: tetratricopeptide repeat protein [Elusimicrobia bacterium]|nr:tetratricopeptide repeat protein [Elusimicrobiota bacterium]
MRILLPALLLIAASGAEAFPFFGGHRDRAAEAALEQARASYEAGDCQAALRGADALLAEKPPAAVREGAYALMGPCYEAGGAADKAIGLYRLAIGLYPDNVFFSSRLADIYNRAGFYENAVPLLLKVLRLRPGDPGATLGLARSYSSLGFLSKAKDYYSRAAAMQNFGEAGLLEEYARCMLRKRDWDEALFLAGKGAALSPRSAVWPLMEARAAAGRGDYHSAAESMERAIRFSNARRLRLERALYLLLGGLPKRAAEAADAELSSSPGDPLASAVKGMALYSLGERAAAEVYFRKAEKGTPFTARLAAAFLGPVKEKEAACAK